MKKACELSKIEVGQWVEFRDGSEKRQVTQVQHMAGGDVALTFAGVNGAQLYFINGHHYNNDVETGRDITCIHHTMQQVSVLIENNGNFTADTFSIVGVFLKQLPSEEQLFQLIQDRYKETHLKMSFYKDRTLRENIRHLLDGTVTFFWCGNCQYFLDHSHAETGAGALQEFPRFGD